MALQFNVARRIHGGQLIALGGINDVAGNRLLREYVKTSPVNDPPLGAQNRARLALRLRHRWRPM
jgi:hypothetical protein